MLPENRKVLLRVVAPVTVNESLNVAAPVAVDGKPIYVIGLKNNRVSVV